MHHATRIPKSAIFWNNALRRQWDRRSCNGKTCKIMGNYCVLSDPRHLQIPGITNSAASEIEEVAIGKHWKQLETFGKRLKQSENVGTNLKKILGYRNLQEKLENCFSNFSCMFLNPNNFFQFELLLF